MPQYDIFISYSRHDENKVHPICNRLEKSGFTVWIDKDGIESGDAFKKIIVEAIESSKVFLFFSSANSNNSYWTTKEVGLAIEEKKPVIPIRLDDSKYNKEIRFDLTNIDYIDATKGYLDDTIYNHLIRSVANKCGKNIASQPKPVQPAQPKSVQRAQPKPVQRTAKAYAPSQLKPVQSRPVQAYSAQHTTTAKRKPAKSILFNKILNFIEDWGGWVLFWIACVAVGYWEFPAVKNLFHKDTPTEIYAKAIKYYNAKDYEEAVPLMQKAAEAGDADAQCFLGFMYYKGEGVAQDYAEAIKWYRLSAEQNNASAQYNIGYKYFLGTGVQLDYAQAFEWFKKSAGQDYPLAQCMLGVMYQEGKGVQQDYTEAVKWYQKAAEQGCASAQNSLGNMYFSGYGVTKNYVEAANLFRKAAEQDNATAQYDLGYVYEKGFGVPQNLDEAIKWYKKAADQGEESALKALTRLGIN